MAIYKSKHVSNYTVIPNEIFNSGLSIEAIGLLTYFLSLPHDWVIYKTTLHNSLNIGRDKLDKIFKELTDNKYIKSTKSNNNGKITYEHIVYDKPYTEIPFTEKPSTVKPYTEKPSTVNPHLQSTKKPSTNKPSNKEINIIDFDVFWNLYDHKIARKKCLTIWKKLTNEDKQKIIDTLPSFLKTVKSKEFQPYPSTYLNNERWNDEIKLQTIKTGMVY